MHTIDITRTEAAKILEALRRLVADPQYRHNYETFRYLVDRYLRGGLDADGRAGQAITRTPIPALQQCTGAAHSNAFIDNCPCCAPRWGFVGPTVRVR